MADYLSYHATIRAADGVETTVRTNTYDLYRAEKSLQRPLAIMRGVLLVEEMFAVIHSAAMRAGIAGDDLDAWLAEVDIALSDDPDDGEVLDDPLSPTGSVSSSSEPE